MGTVLATPTRRRIPISGRGGRFPPGWATGRVGPAAFSIPRPATCLCARSRRAYLPGVGRLTNRPARAQTSWKWVRSRRLSSRRERECSRKCWDSSMRWFTGTARSGLGSGRSRMPSPRATGRRCPHLHPIKLVGDSESGKHPWRDGITRPGLPWSGVPGRGRGTAPILPLVSPPRRRPRGRRFAEWMRKLPGQDSNLDKETQIRLSAGPSWL
jgi:hypothetical protein